MSKELILHIETATSMCSVALSSGNKLLAVKELNERNVHASQITLFIDEVMKSAGKNYADLQAVAVSKGPGSYTGLRIGVSTAKGLCFALDIPLIAVDTLEAMAAGFLQSHPNTDTGSLLCPMIDARRMEVYTAVFQSDMKPVEQVQAKILDEHSFEEYLSKNRLIVFGDGAVKTREIFSANPNYQYIEFENSAVHQISLALQKLRDRNFENVAYFEPFYLKDFIASTPKKIS